MARFRTAAVGTITADTENLAGGEAFTQSKKVELISIMVTSLLKDSFYRSANDTAERLAALVNEVEPEYAAKAALLTRHEFGNRSVSHLAAGELAQRSKGKEWASRFYEKIVHRADDILEILGYIIAKNGGKKSLPSRVKRGLGKALSSLNAYQLAKYRGETSSLKMLDAVRILHPKPSEAIDALVKGTLEAPYTWEVELTRAGKEGKSKAAVWGELLSAKKLGYMARLRNIRNIVEADKGLAGELADQLEDREAIKCSLVFPYRFQTALEVVKKISGKEGRRLTEAIDKALEYALDNVPKFEGNTLVAIDQSGSMQKHRYLAGFFGVALAKVNDADLLTFDDAAYWQNYQKRDSLLSIVERMGFPGGGTDFKQIFHAAALRRAAYDRIIILSDMQSWVGYNSPQATYRGYCSVVGKKAKIFSFDVAGYGTTQFPEKDVYEFAGFNGDAVFKIMALLEKDQRAMVNTVEAVEL